jgi:hypothetical protein
MQKTTSCFPALSHDAGQIRRFSWMMEPGARPLTDDHCVVHALNAMVSAQGSCNWSHDITVCGFSHVHEEALDVASIPAPTDGPRMR